MIDPQSNNGRILIGLGCIALEFFLNFYLDSRTIIFGLGFSVLLLGLGLIPKSTPASLTAIGGGEALHSVLLLFFGRSAFGGIFVVCMAFLGLGLALWLRPVGGDPDTELEHAAGGEMLSYYLDRFRDALGYHCTTTTRRCTVCAEK
jgi:hypothetical protein